MNAAENDRETGSDDHESGREGGVSQRIVIAPSLLAAHAWRGLSR